MTLVACDLAFAYNRRPILSAVSFEARPGRITAVLGVNGAGKSTLLRLMGGLARPSAGKILLDGCDLATLGRRETARRIAYVPQSIRPEHLSVFAAVLLGRRPHMGLSPSRRDMLAVEKTLQSLGLATLAFRHLDELSGGELQKTAIARALVQEPTALLLDEPTGSLDIKNTLETFTIIRKATLAKGVAAVAVLHDISLAMRFADDFVLLRNGSVYARVTGDSLTVEDVRAVYGVDMAFGEVGGHKVATALDVTRPFEGAEAPRVRFDLSGLRPPAAPSPKEQKHQAHPPASAPKHSPEETP